MPGGWELVVLLVVAVLIFGGTRVAGLGKNAGKAIHDFREEVTKKDLDAGASLTSETSESGQDGGKDVRQISDSQAAFAPADLEGGQGVSQIPESQEASVPADTEPAEQN